MIMIIAIISIFFLSYEVFDQQLKIIFRKSSCLPEKIHPHLFTPPPVKNSKFVFALVQKRTQNKAIYIFYKRFF